MTKDIEREAFEKALTGNNIHNLHICTIFDEEKNEYFASDTCDPSEDHIVESINLSWRMWRAAKAHEAEKLKGCVVVAEWISIEDQLPEDGQKCLVVFEVMHSFDNGGRYIGIDSFNEGEFDSIAEYEDQASAVALPAGSTISKARAVCWVPTELSNKPLTFDQFYVEAARGGNE